MADIDGILNWEQVAGEALSEELVIERRRHIKSINTFKNNNNCSEALQLIFDKFKSIGGMRIDIAKSLGISCHDVSRLRRGDILLTDGMVDALRYTPYLNEEFFIKVNNLRNKEL